MLRSFGGGLGLILIAVFAVSPAVAAADVGSEVFVVSSSFNGDANYLSLTDRDNLSSQEILQLTSDTVINSEVSYQWSTGNGLGDFNNDGHLDYIMAIGFWFGNIYVSEKLGAGNQFAEPFMAANWGQDGGFYCMDLAVADFNEDGNADFVLSLDYTTNSALYLGDGAFGFEYKPLLETAAEYSSGADAADFNNDGHADFVIAPGFDGPFYVNLGHGDGSFTTIPFDSIDGGSISGVAAADFTGDGIADIAAVYSDKLYVYEGSLIPGEWDIVDNEWVNVGAGGTIDGVAFTYLASNQLPLPLNISGLDNLDFDGDGNQDLVVASYGADLAGVAVLLGQGDGTFNHFHTYLGGSGDERNAVTARPWEPVPNVAPVAVIEPASIEGTAGEEIVFNGANSIDEDGQIVSYVWDFGDAGLEATGANASYTYQASGNYVVTLSVTDDQGETSSVQAQVAVAEPEPVVVPPAKGEVPAELKQIAVKVKFSPHELKLDDRKGHGKKGARHHKVRHLKAKIRFAEGFDARNVDPSSVHLVANNGPEIAADVKNKHGFFDKLARFHRKPKKSISVRFDRQKVIENLAGAAANKTTLTVRGKIWHDEQWKDFEASAMIRIKDGKRRSLQRRLEAAHNRVRY